MEKWDLVLLTQNAYVNPITEDAYAQEIVLEDKLLAESLKNLGLKVCRKSWDDPTFDWSSSRAALFRATWDYFERIQEFQDWFHQVRHKTMLINPAELIEWNLNKKYLLELNRSGIPLPPTAFIEQGSQKTLQEHYASLQLQGPSEKDCVLKPCVSAGAWHTYRIHHHELHKYEEVYAELVKTESLLLQEFQNNVPLFGERSYMIFGKRFSHAVLKKAKAGDFRVQSDYGGTVQLCEPSTEEIELAVRVVEACPYDPVYARVDLFKDNQNQWALAEIELVEPELWFRMDKNSSSLLAQTIYQHLNEKKT